MRGGLGMEANGTASTKSVWEPGVHPSTARKNRLMTSDHDTIGVTLSVPFSLKCLIQTVEV